MPEMIVPAHIGEPAVLLVRTPTDWMRCVRAHPRNHIVPDTLQSMLDVQIQYLRRAEHQLVEVLPRMANSESTASLREVFASHVAEIAKHVERLQHIAGLFEHKPAGEIRHAMKDAGTPELRVDAEKEPGTPASAAPGARLANLLRYFGPGGTIQQLADRTGCSVNDLLHADRDWTHAAAQGRLASECFPLSSRLALVEEYKGSRAFWYGVATSNPDSAPVPREETDRGLKTNGEPISARG